MRNKLNIKIYRGETFNYVIALKDNSGNAIDLTGCTLLAQSRDKSTNEVVFTFTTMLDTPNTDGKLILNLGASASQSLIPTNNLFYDVKITFPSSEVVRWITGDVTILDTVSQ
jgi:hypothetical protein